MILLRKLVVRLKVFVSWLERLTSNDCTTAHNIDIYAICLVATELGDMTVVKECIAKGADINAKRNDGHTALMWASLGGYLDV